MRGKGTKSCLCLKINGCFRHLKNVLTTISFIKMVVCCNKLSNCNIVSFYIKNICCLFSIITLNIWKYLIHLSLVTVKYVYIEFSTKCIVCFCPRLNALCIGCIYKMWKWAVNLMIPFYDEFSSMRYSNFLEKYFCCSIEWILCAANILMQTDICILLWNDCQLSSYA